MKKTVPVLMLFLFLVTPGHSPAVELPLAAILDSIYGAGGYWEIDSAGLFYGDSENEVAVQAKYAGHDHGFGYVDGAGYTEIARVTGSFTDTTPDWFTFTPAGIPWQFALNDLSSGDLWYSNPALNSDGWDHLRTFIAAGTGNWIFAWEDLPYASSDKDFQDLILEAKIAPVPEPASLILLGAGMLGLAGIGRRKLRR